MRRVQEFGDESGGGNGHDLEPRIVREWHAFLERGRGARVLEQIERSGIEPKDFLARIYAKLLRYSDSMDTIERWLDGRVPEDLGVGVSDGSVFVRRGPLTLADLDRWIEAESRV